MKLTAHQRAALELAERSGGELRRTRRPDQPGRDPWPAPHPTLRSLVDRGLLDSSTRRNRTGHRMDVWTLTAAGKTALHPPPAPPRKEQPRYLQRNVSRGGDTTTIPSHSIDFEPGMGAIPVIDPSTLKPGWQQRAQARHARDTDRLTAARRGNGKLRAA